MKRLALAFLLLAAPAAAQQADQFAMEVDRVIGSAVGEIVKLGAQAKADHAALAALQQQNAALRQQIVADRKPDPASPAIASP